MKVQIIDGKQYHLPNELNDFQLRMYVHLINWKWANITKERGIDRGHEYDAILPERYADAFKVLYDGVSGAVRAHHEQYPFRIHKYFNHMASSQAANINLFLPILLHDHADAIFRELNPEFDRLATGCLDHGWRIEFWDEPIGALNDKNAMSGTDADLAIAYYNRRDELCLWLIEHKLTEAEFTTCGGFKSTGRKEGHNCTRNFVDILEKRDTCYYHNVCRYKYWDITAANPGFFVNHGTYAGCPFQGGMNQLWRNQLLALAIETDDQQPYKHAHFSVVKHPKNTYLDKTLNAYRALIDNNPKFSTFTSADVIGAAERHADESLQKWTTWYKELYRV